MVSTLIAQDVPTADSVIGFSPKPEFEEVYQYYWRSILRYLLVKTKDYHLAEDLTSQVFFQALQKYDSFEMRSKPELSAWLFRIARNIFISRKRHEKGANFVDFEEALLYVGDGLEEAVSRKFELVQLRQETRNLPEGQQLIIALTIFFDFTTAEMARIIGISDSNVKVRKHKAKGNLKKLFFGSNHDNGGGRNRSLTVAEIIQITKEVLDLGLPTHLFTRDQFLALKVAKTLEERGHKFKEIVQVWGSLPEGFFERVIEEIPCVPALQIP